MSAIKLFESKQIRSDWNEEEQEWYFAVVDVIAVLTDSNDPKQYIRCVYVCPRVCKRGLSLPKSTTQPHQTSGASWHPCNSEPLNWRPDGAQTLA